MKSELKNKDSFIIYTTDDNNIDVEVYLEDEDLWMTQEQISKLFDKAKSTINEHIKNIYEEGELKEKFTMRKFGNSEFSTKPTNYYNLEMIIAIGYRVKEVAKNYLTLEELDFLNKLVTAYLDVAEVNALKMHAMTMKDWVKELDSFLTMTHNDILNHKGKVSHEKALEKAHKEYDKYMKTHLTQAEKDYLEIMGEDIKKLK